MALGPTREAFAAKHEVGGSQGWDVTANLGSWASSQTFRVGDQLGEFYFSQLHVRIDEQDELMHPVLTHQDIMVMIGLFFAYEGLGFKFVGPSFPFHWCIFCNYMYF